MAAGRIVFITGASSGIGFDTACRFIEAGATVIACDRDRNGLERLQQFSHKKGSIVESFVLDLLDIPSFSSADEIVSRYGRLDVLVNCAGICSGTPLDQITIEEWDRTYAINVKGPFFLTVRLLPFLKKGNQP
jgi:NAD(P)-dependent dehydrogenase (short-subunit alcohol dehydrogenase family)